MRSQQPVLLDVKGLDVAYGKAEVVHGVDLTIHRGEFVVLLGRNGAGKTTTLAASTGLIPKRGGRISLADRDVTNATPREIVAAGAVHVLEGHRVFTSLSVEDNLLIGTYARASGGDRSKLERVYSLFPEMAQKRHDHASRLSGGQQQILAVAQGIIGEPQLLILDEPSSGLAPVVIDRILQVARQLADEGVAILLVEQLVEKALNVADHCYLMATGEIAAQGSPDDIRAGDTLNRVFLGGH
ncbi:ABC transporter ATP-binding protein [Acuticoccus sediminis]|uniref:ABC transporter ATP-binding protein n=1 Tax=Acuticoccus sediminis TaxID=2184697 RepID=A0A8B2NHZ7_9HYPH|nr:ABC transporter ATP-binding protein [Acuticoccus sediminis]RAH99174.1 ABC transporter ATP-binding protein [Acuticoccus sediminis]